MRSVVRQLLLYSSSPGWNSWNRFACNISEDLIRQTADALVSTGLADLGYKYVNIDDCWQASNRAKSGAIEEDRARFPSGMKSLSDYIHSKGLKFGIYSSAGFKTCQGFPASLGLEYEDVKTYADWGVDYLKYDNCYTDHGSPQSRYLEMATAIQTVTAAEGSNKIFYSLCEWGRENPAAWAPKISANSWRISADIRDSWLSIVTRADITASLWRYSGPSAGWNDPDMLEVGNGKCTEGEYRTHFSLWAMLKAPLIIGNDVSELLEAARATSDSSRNSNSTSTLEILSNAEIIAVNQDPLGRQARRVWSDAVDILRTSVPDTEGRLIASKCASSSAQGEYSDAYEDQQWTPQADGSIRSESSGLCLHELNSREMAAREQLWSQAAGFSRDSTLPDSLNFTIAGLSVVASECAGATKWKVGAYQGGSIVSQTTGLCLEVSTLEVLPAAQGKRLQTGTCREVTKKIYIDVREDQSWTLPPGGQMLNLYQRQCLTIDRDALPGLRKEVWVSPLLGGDYAALLFNKGGREELIELTVAMLGGGEQQRYQVRDLWAHEDSKQLLTKKSPVEKLLPAHAGALLRLSPVA
eukprot:gene24294-32731_t